MHELKFSQYIFGRWRLLPHQPVFLSGTHGDSAPATRPPAAPTIAVIRSERGREGDGRPRYFTLRYVRGACDLAHLWMRYSLVPRIHRALPGCATPSRTRALLHGRTAMHYAVFTCIQPRFVPLRPPFSPLRPSQSLFYDLLYAAAPFSSLDWFVPYFRVASVVFMFFIILMFFYYFSLEMH